MLRSFPIKMKQIRTAFWLVNCPAPPLLDCYSNSCEPDCTDKHVTVSHYPVSLIIWFGTLHTLQGKAGESQGRIVWYWQSPLCKNFWWNLNMQQLLYQFYVQGQNQENPGQKSKKWKARNQWGIHYLMAEFVFCRICRVKGVMMWWTLRRTDIFIKQGF